MSRQSALIENGYEKGTKEYNYYFSQMDKLNSKLYKLKHGNLTYNRYFEILRLLKEFRRDGLKFTIGDIDYLNLIEFLEAAYGVLSMESIKRSIQKFGGSYEANPMRYGYNSIDSIPITNKINEVKKLIGADRECL